MVSSKNSVHAKVLMVGPDLSLHGGIVSVVQGISMEAFLKHVMPSSTWGRVLVPQSSVSLSHLPGR